MQIARITDLPDGLRIPGLPESLRDVPLDAAKWKDWRERVIRYRNHIRKQADANEDVRRAVLHLAANDPAYFCVIFGIIYEPRWSDDGKPPGWRPWVPFPFQVEMIRWIVDVAQKKGPRGHGVIEKARDMGASWICCLIAVHFFLFAEAGDVGFSSRSQEEVDVRGNPKSLFTKLRGLLTISPGIEEDMHLPDWLFPAGFKPKVHDKTMLISHPTKPVTIAGSTTTKNTGRGNRTTYWFNDEAAFNPYYGVARSSQVSVTDHIFSVSSAGLDDGGSFKAEAESAQAARSNPDLPGSSYLRIDWFLNPLHDQDWYAQKKKEMNDDYAFAREIEIDYMAGQGDWVYPRSHRIEVGNYPYNPVGGDLHCIVDPGLRDPTAIIYGQHNPQTRRTAWVKSILVPTNDARFIASLMVGIPISGEGGYTMAEYSPYMDFMAWTRSLRCSIEYTGDPFGSHKGGDGARTFYQALMEESDKMTKGKHVIIVMHDFDKKSMGFERRLEALNAALPNMDFDRDAEPLLVAIQQSRYPEQKEASMYEPLKPRHDSWSHFRSAAEFYAVRLDLFSGLSTSPQSRQPVIVNQGGTDLRDIGPTRRDQVPTRQQQPVRQPGIQLHDIRAEFS